MSNSDAMRPYVASWAHFAIPLAHHNPSPTPTIKVSEAAGFLSASLAPSPAAPCKVAHTTACQATAFACKPEDFIGQSRAY